MPQAPVLRTPDVASSACTALRSSTLDPIRDACGGMPRAPVVLTPNVASSACAALVEACALSLLTAPRIFDASAIRASFPVCNRMAANAGHHRT
jgi:hypothetical protein